jgi:catechol 2,3-dioxygenase-like lactoylglutathione lyase family enzyme
VKAAAIAILASTVCILNATSASTHALAATSAKAAAFKAVGVNHISYGVADYARTRDFYVDLFGMEVSHDNGKQCVLSFGDAALIARKSKEPDGKPLVDHIAYTIDQWDKSYVESELRKRGLTPRVDTEESFHIKDPDGFDVQIASKKLMSIAP